MVKPAPRPRILHRCCILFEPQDEIADQRCCCFLPWWHSCAFWAHHEWVLEICTANFEFFSLNTFDVSQIFRQQLVQVVQLFDFLEGIVLGFCLVGLFLFFLFSELPSAWVCSTYSSCVSKLIHFSLKYQGVERHDLQGVSCRLRFECGMTFFTLCLTPERWMDLTRKQQKVMFFC